MRERGWEVGGGRDEHRGRDRGKEGGMNIEGEREEREVRKSMQHTMLLVVH